MMCKYVWARVYVSVGTPRIQKRLLDPLEMDLQVGRNACDTCTAYPLQQRYIN